MSISSRFAVGIHILTLIEFNKNGVTSSDFLAGSVNTNPALIRKIMAMLKKAGLIEVKPGVASAKLAKELGDITLYDVYHAVSVVEENELFSIHDNPNPACPVGQNIQATIEPIFIHAQSAMESVLKDATLADIVQDMTTQRQENR